MTRINLSPVKQGSLPTVEFTWPLPDGHSPDDLTGMAITGVMEHLSTRAVTIIVGSLTVADGPTRLVAWAMAAEDTGTPGAFAFVLRASLGDELIYTLDGSLEIEANQSVTAVSGPSVVGVSEAQRCALDNANAPACGNPVATVADLVLEKQDNSGILIRGSGGDERGSSGAIDLQTYRANDTQVASGITSTISGGGRNVAAGMFSTVGGGSDNRAYGLNSTIAGGEDNQTSQSQSTVAGGMSNSATGFAAVVTGGIRNTASGEVSSVSGGSDNTASGVWSATLPGSRRATATHLGAKVSADSQNFDFASVADDEFAVRATGGVRLVTAIDATGAPTQFVLLTVSGYFQLANAAARKAQLAELFQSIPTADPSVAGELWRDGGIVMISEG